MADDRTSLVGRMRRALRGADRVNERTLQMVERLEARVRRLRSLNNECTAVRVSDDVANRVASGLMTHA